jgi:hypothetical protein
MIGKGMADVYLDYFGTTTGKRKDPCIVFASVAVPSSLRQKVAYHNVQVLTDLLLEKKTGWTECFPVNRHTAGWPPEPVRHVVSQAILGYVYAEDSLARA